jgi:hypothetical protein
VVTATNSFANGDVVRITGVVGNPGANGVWVISGVSGTGFTLVGSKGNGAWVSGGTASRAGVRYSLSDAIPSFVAWSFRTPSTLQQRAGFGCVTREATFQLGQDIADWQAQGECVWVHDSEASVSNGDIEKGGLAGAFPAEPTGSYPTDAGIVAGFTGRAVVGATSIANLSAASVSIRTGNELVKDNFGSYFPDQAEGDERDVRTSFTAYDDDSTLSALHAASINKTPLDIVYQIGTVAANTWLLHLKGVQIGSAGFDDGQRRYKRSYNDCRATGSSISALDEARLTIL